jgi:hypothetical protein
MLRPLSRASRSSRARSRCRRWKLQRLELHAPQAAAGTTTESPFQRMETARAPSGISIRLHVESPVEPALRGRRLTTHPMCGKWKRNSPSRPTLEEVLPREDDKRQMHPAPGKTSSDDAARTRDPPPSLRRAENCSKDVAFAIDQGPTTRISWTTGLDKPSSAHQMKGYDNEGLSFARFSQRGSR